MFYIATEVSGNVWYLSNPDTFLGDWRKEKSLAVTFESRESAQRWLDDNPAITAEIVAA